MRSLHASSLALIASALLACGGNVDTPTPDAAGDSATDAASDTTLDTASDAPADALLSCGDKVCTGDQICQSLLIAGGVAMPPDDAGVCPSGYQNVGGHCQRLPTYSCMPRPSKCTGASIDCACAGDYCLLLSSCPYQCQAASGRTLECLCAVP
jgi:hypothetical protein